MKKVTFCGHRSLAGVDVGRLKKLLGEQIEYAIKCGTEEFLLGGYGDFDILCANTVKEYKCTYPHIKSVLVIAYMDKECNNDLYDCSEYPPIENVPKRFAISKRNEYMVNSSDYVIAFVKNNFGGAYDTLKYAKRKKKDVVNIFLMFQGRTMK